MFVASLDELCHQDVQTQTKQRGSYSTKSLASAAFLGGRRPSKVYRTIILRQIPEGIIAFTLVCACFGTQQTVCDVNFGATCVHDERAVAKRTFSRDPVGMELGGLTIHGGLPASSGLTRDR